MDNLLLKAQSPAALAEEYIVKSIWNQHFPAGTDLPAERELAEHIGVTRTTLREVLQRLARDGWLHIQHGKPTRVNNIWETAGPNILNTILNLDNSLAPVIISNVLSVRIRMAEFYIRDAVKLSPEKSLALFEPLASLEDNAQAFATFDYYLFREFTFVSNKPVFALIFNSFKSTYLQVASLFFSNPEARQLSLNFYRELKNLCEKGDYDSVPDCISRSSQASSAYWGQILQQPPAVFTTHMQK